MGAGEAKPAGSGRAVRLDPFALPVRFSASDARADGQLRLIELHRERVILRRAISGMQMAVCLPVTHYLGVAIRIIPPSGEDDGAVAVVLEHRDGGLRIPLFVAPDGSDALAEWQLWGRVLGLPLLVADSDGSLSEPFRRLGAVRLDKPCARRRRHGAIKKRRPAIFLRRRTGRPDDAPVVHRGEREIIARD
jgi:hypothetical protein